MALEAGVCNVTSQKIKGINQNCKKKYAVWGTGMIAAEFSYQNKGKIMIDFYIDNYTVGGGKRFAGKRCSNFVN